MLWVLKINQRNHMFKQMVNCTNGMRTLGLIVDSDTFSERML